jgi:hypothetical protein
VVIPVAVASALFVVIPNVISVMVAVGKSHRGKN